MRYRGRGDEEMERVIVREGERDREEGRESERVSMMELEM